MIIRIIRFYQRYISSLMRPSCRFYPTCSEYSIMAIKKYGVLKGIIKSFVRIIKCNPLFKPGIDLP